MIDSTIAAIPIIRDVYNFLVKRRRVTVLPHIQIVPKGQEKIHFIKGKIDSDFLVIYKINIINSGEDKKYLELSIRNKFVDKYKREPFLIIKNPIIKQGYNEFIMSMQSKLQPVKNMENEEYYVFLIDSNGNYISRGFKLTYIDCNVGHVNYQLKKLAQEKGKIKDIEQEMSELQIFP